SITCFAGLPPRDCVDGLGPYPLAGRDCRLGRNGFDPPRLSAAFRREDDRPVADISKHECGRRGAVRDQRLVARRDSLGRAQRAVATHRSDRVMADHQEKRIVDLSHVIEHGMTTYPGLPGPHICDFWTREGSAANYDDGSSFQIGRIDMVANTGTYVDAPFHRYSEGRDLADLPLQSLADLPGI